MLAILEDFTILVTCGAVQNPELRRTPKAGNWQHRISDASKVPRDCALQRGPRNYTLK
jgi:hypothetical protein